MSKLRKSPEIGSDFCLSAYFCLIFACESKACAGEIRDTEGRGLNQERYRGEGTESGAWQRGGGGGAGWGCRGAGGAGAGAGGGAGWHATRDAARGRCATTGHRAPSLCCMRWKRSIPLKKKGDRLLLGNTCKLPDPRVICVYSSSCRHGADSLCHRQAREAQHRHPLGTSRKGIVADGARSNSRPPRSGSPRARIASRWRQSPTPTNRGTRCRSVAASR